MDYATKERKAFIKGEAPTNAQKLARAKARLGTKYLLHPANRVQRSAGATETLTQFKARRTMGLE